MFFCLGFGFLFIYFRFAYILFCLCVCYVVACFFSFSFIFVVTASGKRRCVLSSFCNVFFFFLLFFSRGTGYFILHAGGLGNSFSTGQRLTYGLAMQRAGYN